MRVALVTMVPLAVPELLASRVTVASLDPQEQWDWLEPPGQLGLPALWADLGTVERLALLGLVVLPELPEPEVPLALLDPVVRRAWPERRETEG